LRPKVTPARDVRPPDPADERERRDNQPQPRSNRSAVETTDPPEHSSSRRLIDQMKKPLKTMANPEATGRLIAVRLTESVRQAWSALSPALFEIAVGRPVATGTRLVNPQSPVEVTQIADEGRHRTARIDWLRIGGPVRILSGRSRATVMPSSATFAR